ncbi:MAG: class I mannose-6-phosphate isomerase [Paludibacteraceae bacterium]|nr:class I mannose-6-phosphate isomerase [Paludibacteraceae bacterium]
MNYELNKLYPLKFRPILKQKLWGGDKIQNIYRHNEPKLGQVGESWDVSAMEDDDCEVINGWLEGNTLADLVEVYMGDLVGDRVYEQYGAEFPLLLKIIDANRDLSIQVHPNDELAEEEHGLNGKTEMWYVLDAEDDAHIILGFNRYVSKTEYIERLATGNLEEVLQKYPVRKGDVYFIPAGMVHSIGKGCLIMEVQQASDITYRIYDYNRKDADGNLRELHTELAQKAIDFENWQGRKISLQPAQNGIVNLVQCPYFQVNEMQIDKPKEYDLAPINSFVLLSCVEGHVTLKWDDDYLTLVDGETVMIPAEMNSLYIVPTVNTKLLETYINN